MTLVDAGKIIIILAAPGAVMAGVCYAPRWCAALTDHWRQRHPPEPAPYGPPIEQLAADLRRLLRLHGELAASAHSAMCAHRVWAVEAAIGARAIEAAAALGVPHPDQSRAAALTRTELSALLTRLAAAGLVLPARVGGFTTDGRL
ncbi:hypothetical protein [Actinoplanes sp. NPDC049802]|uniref:hypothetical protein n=1 Tax=Actinoplanes sp. NPDC049802 TaxID=3154742 RepID=UPI003410E49C